MKNAFVSTTALLLLTVVFFQCSSDSRYTRGIGVYPGNPEEDFGPVLVKAPSVYRNMALLRPSWHSSAVDYNLTAQLVSDGIIESSMPVTISLTTQNGEVPKNEREWLLDENTITSMTLNGPEVFLTLSLNPEAGPVEADRVLVTGSLIYNPALKGSWNLVLAGSDNGTEWTELGRESGSGYPGEAIPDPFAAFRQPKSKKAEQAMADFASFFAGPADGDTSIEGPSFKFNFGPPKPQRNLLLAFNLPHPAAFRQYRLSLTAPGVESWTLGSFDVFRQEKLVRLTPSQHFTSAWMSQGTATEWVYTDLGLPAAFDKVKLYWINKAVAGKIEVSDDAQAWKEVAALPGGGETTDEVTLASKARGRYVRILMNRSENGKPYVLSEMEVWGKGGLVPRARPNPSPKDNKLTLAGGNWKIQRASRVTGSGDSLSTPGYPDQSWVTATVPGTALMSYLRAGALPDPNYSDNILQISESFFNSDFWYRNEFNLPKSFLREKLFLHFDGINWKAEVYVNGKQAGRIEGAFIRGTFDVTDLVKPGKNALAVRIHKNDHIGVVKEPTALNHDKNGGVLGADNPTYHASIGWDWIPTIRGRNIGIWNDVSLSATGNVTLEDPFVTTDLPLPDTTTADLTISVSLKNHDAEAVNGTLSGTYGEIAFQQEVSLAPNETKTVILNPSSHPELRIKNPVLWWPKGYGLPNLYKVDLEFKPRKGKVSDHVSFMSGIREMAFTEDHMILNMFINGRRFIGRGGNWGFPESNLAYRGREYDVAVAYHADMNFTMIRNWVGQTADDEFFEACDRHGIMVWQDFCLANPADGPDPDNPGMFLANAEDVIKKIRNHPSIGIYVGRNEGNPPAVIDTALRKLVTDLHPGLHYISNSAMGVVSGGGPYQALPPRDYFLLYGYNRFHSERGMPNVMTWESLSQTLPDSALWPQNRLWGFHDYSLESAQSCASFNNMVEKGFGKAKDAKEFTELAQWFNYDGYRAMFEGRSLTRQGLLLWMSHPAWPSMVWQTYDYYFEPTAAYFACKKASEPLHIQWNPVYNTVEVVNYHARDQKDLTAVAQIFNTDGSLQWQKYLQVDCREDSTASCMQLEFPPSLSEVHFIRLYLFRGKRVVSDNLYWRGLQEGNYKALRGIPAVTPDIKSLAKQKKGKWEILAVIRNNSKTPALMIRLKVTGKKSGERILPVLYSDNYFCLMPGEERVVTMKFSDADTRGEEPVMDVSGFNVTP